MSAAALLSILCAVHFFGMWVLFVSRANNPLRAAVTSLWKIDAPELFEYVGALVATRIWIDHHWWRAVTVAFVHGSWLHAVLNLMALFVLGRAAELALGRVRMLIVFFASSVVGCLASVAVVEAPILVGASAGIFGLGGCVAVLRRFASLSVQRSISWVRARRLAVGLVGWIAIGFIFPLLDWMPLLAQAGHIGGLVIGTVLGAFYAQGHVQRARRYTLLLIVVMVGVCTAAAAVRPSWSPRYHLYMGYGWLDRARPAHALRSFEAALALDPGDSALKNTVAYQRVTNGHGLDRAELLAREIVSLSPKDPNFLDTLGWIRCKQGYPKEGEIFLRRAAATVGAAEIREIAEHQRKCRLAN